MNKIHPLEIIYPRSLKYLSNKLHGLVKTKLWLKVLIGMGLGIILGILLGPDLNIINPELSSLLAEWIALPGVAFIKVIQMIVIPLVFASIIKGIASTESVKQLKKTGIGLAIYFITTTTIAIVIGIILVTLINPGSYVGQDFIDETAESNINALSIPTMKDLPEAIGTLLPGNIFGSLLNANMLQIVIFSIIFGIALVNMNVEQSKPLLEVLGSIQNVCMTIVKWTMLLAPVAVFGLILRLVSQVGIQTLLGLGVYVLTVLLGLILLMIFYVLIVYIVSRMRPLDFLKKIRDVQLLAFSTSSSAAVMPLTMQTAEEKLNVRPSIAQFVIPIGATVNMDGTALYQAVATIFLAQVFGIEIGMTALVLIVLTIIGASIGTPGTPGVGLAILSVVLGSVGVPIAGLALILGVDRILDMCRTTINVTGDLTASVILSRFIEGETSLKKVAILEKKHEKQRERSGQDIIIIKEKTPAPGLSQ